MRQEMRIILEKCCLVSLLPILIFLFFRNLRLDLIWSLTNLIPFCTISLNIIIGLMYGMNFNVIYRSCFLSFMISSISRCHAQNSSFWVQNQSYICSLKYVDFILLLFLVYEWITLFDDVAFSLHSLYEREHGPLRYECSLWVFTFSFLSSFFV